jgi:hypothetical protein
MKTFMKYICNAILLYLAVVLTSCSSSIKDENGNPLPLIGKEARYIGKDGWLPIDENTARELTTAPRITPPSWDASPDKLSQYSKMLDDHLSKNADRLIKQGRVLEIKTGTAIRILGYYQDDITIRPVRSGEKMAMWVKVEVLEGSAKLRTGFATTDTVQ